MKNSKIFSAAAILATIFAFNACDDSQSVEAPEPSGNLVSHPIEVNIDGTKSGQTDVAELADKVITVTAAGAESKAIKVSDIIAKANNISDADLENYLAKYKCEYESGDDGFKPSNKGERCAPVSCSLSNKSYINVDTFGVFYDDDAPMQDGCFSVRNISKVLMYEVNQNAVEIYIYLDNELLAKLDASTLTTTKAGDKDAVTLETLIKSAKADIDLSKYLCDFRNSDNDKPLSEIDASCAASNCGDLASQFLILEKAAISDGKDANACYEVENVKAVYISTIRDSYDAYEVTVILNGKEVGKVDIAKLADKATTVNSVASVTVEQILEAAGVTADLSKATCDAASLNNADPKDDYKPVTSGKGSCSTSLSCTDVKKMTVSLVGDHKLTAGEGFANCYSVGGFNTIEITTTGSGDQGDKDKPTYASYEIEVTLDGKSIGKADVATLTDKVQEVEGKPVVYVSDIIAAVKSDIDLDKTWCDYLSTDGKRPGDAGSGDCKEIRTCASTRQAYYALTDNDKNRVFDIPGPACYGTKYIKSIDIFSTNPNK